MNQQDSWFSTTTLQQKFIDLIHWHDGLGKKWSDCATKYMAKGYSSSNNPVSSAYLNKVYCQYARQFYPEKGLRFYAAMRALQMKPMRLPKPQVKRGQFPA